MVVRSTMVWQKIVRHISNERIIVESKSGNQYPVEFTGLEGDADFIYSSLTNVNDEKTLWAWVEFTDNGPQSDWYQTGSPYGGPPENPPGEN